MFEYHAVEAGDLFVSKTDGACLLITRVERLSEFMHCISYCVFDIEQSSVRYFSNHYRYLTADGFFKKNWNRISL